jgi:glycosyltransferase involved in cell wall biosynthesis
VAILASRLRHQRINGKPRILIIAEAANPEWVSVPLIGWSLALAISRLTPVHLITQIRNREAILRWGLVEGRDFTSIDSERFAAPLHRLAERLRGGSGVGWTTVSALSTISYYYFERLVWKQFRDAIVGDEFDVIHRITPLSPTTPSTLASRCMRAGKQFILGPLNGGVAWPKEFQAARRTEREWLSYVRRGYRLLPGYSKTLACSSALIAGSKDTLASIPRRFQNKTFYVPENAVDILRFASPSRLAGNVLRGCFVGRLVAYKGPDILIEAVSPLLRGGRLKLDIIGDGPLMPRIRELLELHELDGSVTLHGWVPHERVGPLMSESQVLLFPSIREFGGGVVLEAMALGLVPVVIDYAGPSELVNQAVGFKIPLAERKTMIETFRETVRSICDNPGRLNVMREAARERVSRLFTWDAKAEQILQIYDWVLAKDQSKPDFGFHQ